nr:hypothetical protein 12 [Desulfobacterales bacterium]
MKRVEMEDEKGRSNLPAMIPNDKLDEVIDLSGDQTSWVKPVEGGFKLVKEDKYVKTLTGRIVDVTLYLMKFEDSGPTKMPHVKDDLQIPEGFERRCDVKLDVGGQLIGLSLAPSSAKYHLSPYLKFLRNQGLRPEDVVTTVTSRRASNDKGSWSVACFEAVSDPQTEPGSDKSPDSIPEEWK